MANMTLRVGDRVRWMSGGRMAEGQVVKIAFESGRMGDFVYDASREDPRYIIETDEGRRAAHRAEALSRAQSARAEGDHVRTFFDKNAER
ncbi:MAG TPA: DUF2945 domain-containing protein [Pyrinomonadaceae bacterium]|nr:DUF2945 domain-containing protein [Pyrinomonadaceae bacterium]